MLMRSRVPRSRSVLAAAAASVLLIYDIQDVGARPYTYLSTLRGCLEAAAEKGIEMWVLDRPDPQGGAVIDGPVLEERFESFVGPHPIPLRYAMTPGEFARMVN